ncbi:hypothetical protein Tco_1276280 [Tanacetum coccineum]
MLEEFTGWFRTLICERHANNLQDPESRDERRTTQNSGICAPGPDGEMFKFELQEISRTKIISDDEDPLPHDLADSDVEDLINDDDGVEKVYSSEEED